MGMCCEESHGTTQKMPFFSIDLSAVKLLEDGWNKPPAADLAFQIGLAQEMPEDIRIDDIRP